MIEHIEQATLPTGKKACIALTSWRKRINTVGLTIFNLLCMCGPEFHIVLTLATDEFPRKERELPRDLILMNQAGVFEILWIKKNVKVFKKWLFCAFRYSDTPVITADDDCIYKCNYAQKLYDNWLKRPAYNISYTKVRAESPYFGGPSSLFSPIYFSMWKYEWSKYNGEMLHDDVFHKNVILKYSMKYTGLYDKWPFIFHDEISPVNGLVNNPQWKKYLD